MSTGSWGQQLQVSKFSIFLFYQYLKYRNSTHPARIHITIYAQTGEALPQLQPYACHKVSRKFHLWVFVLLSSGLCVLLFRGTFRNAYVQRFENIVHTYLQRIILLL